MSDGAWRYWLALVVIVGYCAFWEQDKRLSALEAAAGHCDCAPAETLAPDGGP